MSSGSADRPEKYPQAALLLLRERDVEAARAELAACQAAHEALREQVRSMRTEEATRLAKLQNEAHRIQEALQDGLKAAALALREERLETLREHTTELARTREHAERRVAEQANLLEERELALAQALNLRRVQLTHHQRWLDEQEREALEAEQSESDTRAVHQKQGQGV